MISRPSHPRRLASSLLVVLLATSALVSSQQVDPPPAEVIPALDSGESNIGLTLLFTAEPYTVSLNNDVKTCFNNELTKELPDGAAYELFFNGTEGFGNSNTNTSAAQYVTQTDNGLVGQVRLILSSFVTDTSFSGLRTCILTENPGFNAAFSVSILFGPNVIATVGESEGGGASIDAWIAPAVVGGLALIGLLFFLVWFCMNRGTHYAVADYSDGKN